MVELAGQQNPLKAVEATDNGENSEMKQPGASVWDSIRQETFGGGPGLNGAHERVHAQAGEKGAEEFVNSLPDLDELKDPDKGLELINKISDWVAEREKKACIDPGLLENTLMDFAHKSVNNWKEVDGQPDIPDNQYQVYEQFDKLTEKLEELKKGDSAWDNGGRENFYRKLPWHFMPQSN